VQTKKNVQALPVVYGRFGSTPVEYSILLEPNASKYVLPLSVPLCKVAELNVPVLLFPLKSATVVLDIPPVTSAHT
jgi:hypothetical protein